MHVLTFFREIRIHENFREIGFTKKYIYFFCKQIAATYCRLNSAKSAMSSTIHSGNDENGVPESEFIGNFTVIAPMVMVFVLFFVDVSPEKKVTMKKKFQRKKL